jgi:hypothetical protein
MKHKYDGTKSNRVIDLEMFFRLVHNAVNLSVAFLSRCMELGSKSELKDERILHLAKKHDLYLSKCCQ